MTDIRMQIILWLLTIWLVSLLVIGLAQAQTATRSYYNRNGSFAGQSFTRGNSTSFSDGQGRFSAHGNSTSFYDRNGHFTGSVSTPDRGDDALSNLGTRAARQACRMTAKRCEDNYRPTASTRIGWK